MGEVPERSGGDGGTNVRIVPDCNMSPHPPCGVLPPQAGEEETGICMNKRIKIKPDSFFPHSWGKCRSAAEAMGGRTRVLCQTVACPPIPPTGYSFASRGICPVLAQTRKNGGRNVWAYLTHCALYARRLRRGTLALIFAKTRIGRVWLYFPRKRGKKRL